MIPPRPSGYTMTNGQAVWALFDIILRIGLIAYMVWFTFEGDYARATWAIALLIWIDQRGESL